MTHHEIQDLLDRYWEGETTLEEERRLRTYFASGAVDARFLSEAPYFQAVREEQALQAPPVVRQAPLPLTYSTVSRWAVAAAVVALVGLAGWWAVRSPQPVMEVVAVQQSMAQPQPLVESPLSPVSQEATPQTLQAHVVHRKPRLRRVNAVPPAPAHQTLDPETEKALQEVRSALALLSSKLNKGKRAATRNIEQVETLDRFFKHKKETEG